MGGIRTPAPAALLATLLLGAVGCGDRDTVTLVPAGTPTEQQTHSVPGSQAPSAPDLDISVVPVGPSGATGPSPYAWINGPYTVRVGKQVELDGSGSYARDGFLVKYEWDLDADGTFDRTSATPELAHSFSSEYVGRIVLRVTDSSGRTGLATTHLSVSSDGDEEPGETDNCPEDANPGQEDEDQDGLGDVCDPTPGWPTEDAPGVSEG